jgi:hypothetical protein
MLLQPLLVGEKFLLDRLLITGRSDLGEEWSSITQVVLQLCHLM